MNVEIVNANHISFDMIPQQIDSERWALVGSVYNRSDERWIGSADNEIACIWGLIPPSLMSDQAYIWLFHNELVEKHKFAFIRHSQVQVQRMLKLYPYIVGDCQLANTTGRRWLQWLGAKFKAPNPYGLAPFEIKASANG